MVTFLANADVAPNLSLSSPNIDTAGQETADSAIERKRSFGQDLGVLMARKPTNSLNPEIADMVLLKYKKGKRDRYFDVHELASEDCYTRWVSNGLCVFYDGRDLAFTCSSKLKANIRLWPEAKIHADNEFQQIDQCAYYCLCYIITTTTYRPSVIQRDAQRYKVKLYMFKRFHT